MSESYYLAGPMTGIPQFNFPLFEAAAKSLRGQGFTIITPHEMDSPEVQRRAWASPDGKIIDGQIAGETWGDMLARDVKIVADKVTGLVLLPGWENSKGALLESFVGLLCNRDFRLYDPEYGGTYQYSKYWVATQLVAGFFRRIA